MGYPGSLHNHTEYSNARLRDSINRASELIDYAIELGQEVIAITEHDILSNAIKVEEYYEKIKKENPNFKVILGNEIYLCRNELNQENFIKGEDSYFHFILLAKNATGHKQIRQLSTRAWKRSYVTNKMRRTPTYYSDIIEIIGKDKGNVIGSSACLGGFLPRKLLQWRENQDEKLYENIIEWVKRINNIFGDGDFYLEMQPSNNEEQIFVNKQLYLISKKLGIPFIITTDSHYLKREDAFIHKAYLNSQDGEREVDSFYASAYLMGTEELESFFPYFGSEILEEAYKNILEIKNKCEDYTLKKPLVIPELKWKQPSGPVNIEKYYDKIPSMKTLADSPHKGDRHLAVMIADKFAKMPELETDEMFQELEGNLQSVIKSSEVNNACWSNYFLNLQYTIDVCWNAGTLVSPGRGSGVGFVLLYLLDIIQINALREKTKIFAWRFLNPERVSVLDIDTDIEGSKRAKVIQALKDEYGEDRVANVATFGSEGSKQSIMTAARGLDIELEEAAYISSLIPADRGAVRTLKQCYFGDKEKGFSPVPLFVQAMKENPELWRVAQKIEGLVSRLGIHAGGIIFVNESFDNSTALMRAPNGDIMTQFDLHDSEKASLIKIDSGI